MAALSTIVFIQSCLHKSSIRVLIQVKVSSFISVPENNRLIDLGQILSAAVVGNWRHRYEKYFMSESENLPTKKGAIVYACSGCSDAGELADRIARRLTREGVAEMSCLAGIGGRVKPLVNKAAAAERILAIDGCPLNCARHTLELAGIKNFAHLELHQLGLRKNSCPVTDERVAAGVDAAKQILSSGSPPAASRENSVALGNQIS